MRQLIHKCVYLILFSAFSVNNYSNAFAGSVTGIVTDADKGHRIAYATVAIYTIDSLLIEGTLCDSMGNFRLENIPSGSYNLVVSGLAYKDTIIQGLTINSPKAELVINNLELQSRAELLDQVIVNGRQSLISYRNDKKIIHIGEYGGSDHETIAAILARSTTVGIDAVGNITVRGSSHFKVLIDGKPALQDGAEALQSIPASLVDHVEMITNPSAKYSSDSESGIINVIMKKENFKGLNGLLSATAGYGNKGNYESGTTINLNYRNEQVVYYLQFYGRFDTLYGFGNVMTHIYDETYDFNKSRRSNELRFFYLGNILTGLDLKISPKNTASFMASGNIRKINYAATSEDSFSESFSSLNSIGILDYTSIGNHLQWQASLEDRHQFVNHSQKLHVLIDYSMAISERDNDRRYFSGVAGSDNPTLTDHTLFTQDEIRHRVHSEVNYEWLTNDSVLIESGILHEIYLRSNDFRQAYFDITIEDETINYMFNIINLYGNVTGRYKKINYGTGVRFEVSEMELTDINTRNIFSLYPTVQVSRQILYNSTIRGSYSKRIRRPSISELSPVILYSDDQATWRGNPRLKHSDIHSFELGLSKHFNTVETGIDLFYRNIRNGWQTIAELDTENHFLYIPVNVKQEQLFGTEFNINIRAGSKFMLNGSGSFFLKSLSDIEMHEALKQYSSNFKLTLNYRLPRSVSVQLNGNYTGRDLRINGYQYAFYFIDISLQKEFGKSFSLSLMARDLFNTRNYKTHFSGFNADGMSYTVKDHFDSSVPSFLITLSYTLNSYKHQNKNTNYETYD